MDRIRVILRRAENNEGDDEAEARASALVLEVKVVCGAVHEEDLRRCIEMGRLGAGWLWEQRRGKMVNGKERLNGNSNGKGHVNGNVHGNGNGHGAEKGLKVLTVCNTGSLATSVRFV